MNPADSQTERRFIAAHAMERRSLAFLHTLVETCREWPELKKWLCEDFVSNGKTRENFLKMVNASSLPSDVAVLGLAEMAEEARGWRKEKARMQAGTGASAPRIYGGRTWSEIEQYAFRYEGGVSEMGVSVLARHWRKTGARAKYAPELQRAGAEFLDAVIHRGQPELLAKLARAVALLNPKKRVNLKALLGRADWWKLQACLYILRNPQASYRTRDIRAQLARLGITISSLDFRRFCKRHGICRDERAGRPRTRRKTPSPMHRMQD